MPADSKRGLLGLLNPTAVHYVENIELDTDLPKGCFSIPPPAAYTGCLPRNAVPYSVKITRGP